MNAAKKAAPVFAGSVALVRISSPCQIHPLIAQIWRSRLPRYIVNFSARSAANISVLNFLGEIELREGEGYYGHGHDQVVWRKFASRALERVTG